MSARAPELFTPHCSEWVELAGLQPVAAEPSAACPADVVVVVAADTVAAAAALGAALGFMSAVASASPLAAGVLPLSAQCCVGSSSKSALASWSPAMSQLSLSQSLPLGVKSSL